MKCLKLIRYPNLLIIAFTMYLLRYCIVQPLLQYNGFQLQLSHTHFFLLVLATMMLTAAGYIINDYYDMQADEVNKPDKVIIGKSVSANLAMNLYMVINFIAISIGIYISYMIDVRLVGMAFIIVAGLLWFYSTSYKGMFVIGNLMVAFFAGLVPLMVFLFEVPMLNNFYKVQLIGLKMNFNYLFGWTGFFAVFAFLLTLIREIIKDAEDFEGDKAYGQHTLPVKFGLFTTKIVVVSLLLITIAFMIFLFTTYIADVLTVIYFIIFIIIPLLFIGFKVYKAETQEQYHKASSLCKWVMLTGILYAVVVRFVILK